MSKEVYIGFVCISIIVLCYIIGYIVRKKEKAQLQKVFFMQVVALLICNIGYLLLVSSDLLFDYKNIIFECILFLGVTFSSVFLVFIARIYKAGGIKFDYKCKLVILPQIITNVILWTNSYHHLFYKTYGITEQYDFGPYFYIAMAFTWINLISALVILIQASMKNSKNFSKQSALMMWGTLIPVLFNLMWTLGSVLNIDILRFYSYYDVSPITLTITAICFALAIFKYGFLDVIPIALQKVVDCMSDGYAIINTKMEIIDFNRTFSELIAVQSDIKGDIDKVLSQKNILNEEMLQILKSNIAQVLSEKNVVAIENVVEIKNKICSIELTPIKDKDELIGIIIMFKDVTELKKSQNAMIEQERMASLGQLAGGMAHDINTPIATIRMGIDFLTGKHEYTEQEAKMLEAMRVSASKITEIVESVRNQIRNTGESQKTNFMLEKVIDNIKILVNNELQKNKCKLIVESDPNISLYGDFGKLSQIIMNIVMNSIQAYTGDNGLIKICTYKTDNEVTISVNDNAGGIPQKIADGLFKEILTTKGTKGTGVGLYFSNSMLKAEFNGSMSFETEEGIGSTFYVKIPM